ncbi:MAG: hypothetical protein EXS67_03235 [Candidatus Margulisbacteria bacterium]|nr:hypothetical protein [Candidatus Margulisiibacteriota bacterium]
MGIGAVGPSFIPKSPGNSIDSVMAKHFRSEGFQRVFEGLGLDPKVVTRVTTEVGSSALGTLKELNLVPVTQDRALVLSKLGFGAVDLIISMKSQEELSKIRKRLSDIQGSMLDPEAMAVLLSSLGLEVDEETLVYSDEEGGLFVVQSSLKEIEGSLD